MDHVETLANGLEYTFLLPNEIALGVDLHVEAVYSASGGDEARARLREIMQRWAEAGCANAFAPPFNPDGGFHGPAHLVVLPGRDDWTVDMRSALASEALRSLLAQLEAWAEGPVAVESLVLTMN